MKRRRLDIADRREIPRSCFQKVMPYLDNLSFFALRETCRRAASASRDTLSFRKAECCAIHTVSRWGYALETVESKTFEVCWTAVTQDGGAIRFSPFQSQDIRIQALQTDVSSIVFMENPGHTVCYEAVRLNGFTVEMFKNPSPALIDLALQDADVSIEDLSLEQAALDRWKRWRDSVEFGCGS